MTPDEILKRLSCYYNEEFRSFSGENENAMYRIIDRFELSGKEKDAKRYYNQSVSIYTTSRGEKLTYFCNGHGYYDLDGRCGPCVWTYLTDINGDEISHISIRDIWNMFYELSEKDISLVACVVLVYYHLQLKDNFFKSYKRVSISDINGDLDISWLLPRFDDDIISSLNEMIGEISVGHQGSISFEAFIYYWELELSRRATLPQSSRYQYHDERLELFKTVFWIAGYFMGTISYGDLLLYIKDYLPGQMGVSPELLSVVTKGAVHDIEAELTRVFVDEDIEFLKRSSMRVGQIRISYLICIPGAKLFLLDKHLAAYEGRMLEETDWRALSLSEIKDRASFDSLLQFIRSNIR